MSVVTPGEAAAIERAVADFEARTGIEIVAAVERRADLYPEVPWRAFALGAALAALSIIAWHVFRPGSAASGAPFAAAAGTLGVGAVVALASMLLPGLGRLFIRGGRMDEEVRQRAEVVFLTREMFATPSRDAILVLVSLFERRVVVVPDAAWRGRIAAESWRAVVARMTPLLAQRRLVEAFDTGFAAIEATLVEHGVVGRHAARRLSDTLVQGEEP